MATHDNETGVINLLDDFDPFVEVGTKAMEPNQVVFNELKPKQEEQTQVEPEVVEQMEETKPVEHSSCAKIRKVSRSLN